MAKLSFSPEQLAELVKGAVDAALAAQPATLAVASTPEAPAATFEGKCIGHQKGAAKGIQHAVTGVKTPEGWRYKFPAGCNLWSAVKGRKGQS